MVPVMMNRLPVQDTQDTRIQSLGREDPLQKELTTHSSMLDWEFHGQGAWQAAVHGVIKSQTQLSGQVQSAAQSQGGEDIAGRIT